MLNILYVIVALLALMFMIVVHEFGHFIAGRKLGFQVNEFAIGFGPPIYKRKTKWGGQFSIRPIPLGGFCAFEGEEDDNDNPKAFNNMPPWKRIIVLFMGAFFNFVSAMIIITIFFSAYGEQVAVVGKMYEGGKNSEIMQEGDIILAVDGKIKHILMNDDFSDMLAGCGDTATLKILRNGKTQKVVIEKGSYKYFAPVAERDFYQILYIEDNAYRAVNLDDGWSVTKIDGKKKNADTPLTELKSGTSVVFEKDGVSHEGFITVVRRGDRLTYLNDNFVPPMTTTEYDSLSKSLKNGDYIMFQQELEGGSYSVPVLLSQDTVKDFSGNVISDFSYFGFVSGHNQLIAGEDGNEPANFGFTRRLSSEKLGFFRSLGRSFTYSFFIVFKVLALLGQLITGKMGLESAGGPITVISTMSSGIRQAGFPYLLYITCILSANVAVMNLLPLPALDGSKIVLTAVEWIRGKPLNRKVEAVIHTVGMVLLFTFTIFIDIFHMIK